MLCIRNNLIIAILYLLLIPIWQGVSNLDSQYTAQCLEKTVALAGILLFVPLCNPEYAPALRETVLVRCKPYWKLVLMRLGMAFLCLILLCSSFLGIMQYANCVFPFAEYFIGTVITALCMGLVGLLVAIISSQVIAGYLAALGVYLMSFFKVLAPDAFGYLFAMSDGGTGYKWQLGGLCVILVLLILHFARKN